MSNKPQFWGAVFCCILAACSTAGTDTGNPGGAGAYISDSPIGEWGHASSSTEEGEGDPQAPYERDPARVIAEADLIQVKGDRLYALAEGSGLHMIDISDPDSLEHLGWFRFGGSPFEMYLDEETLVVLVNGYLEYVFDEEAGAYHYEGSARVVALEVANPSSVQMRGSYSVPGRILDSRRVGDVLYVVSAEDGWCWRCDIAPNTAVTSLDLSDLDDIHIADQLRFEGEEDEYSWLHPVAVTGQRMYVGSDSWSETEGARSTIDVIDISDPDGRLALSAQVPLAGAVESRWQMDEYQGVLRVIAQAQSSLQPTAPVVETFAVESSDTVRPLGKLQMRLPRPERLRSVRFDADRAFAVTAEDTDPLFTLDLSDPAAPAQLGELEIPGFMHYMEPRGDRLLALGLEAGNAQGSLHVSLFDVSDLSSPVLIERAYFGGDNAEFNEGQDRIHKALGVHEAQGLLTIPFSSWSFADDAFPECPPVAEHGIQLVDWAEDGLQLRGAAQVNGRPRRGFLHEQRLLSVSDETVQSFDIEDRDAPVETASVRISRAVSSARIAGDKVVRLSTDPDTRTQDVLDVVPLSDAEAPQSPGELDLVPLVPESVKSEPGMPGSDASCLFEWGEEGIFTLGSHLYLASFSFEGLILSIFELGDEAMPRFVDHVLLPIRRSHPELEGGPFGAMAVQIEGALVFADAEREWQGEKLVRDQPFFAVVDLSDPENPDLRRVARPEGFAYGGISRAGDLALSYRMEEVDGEPDKVKGYVDRLDVSNPSAPELLAPLNVPGPPIRYSAQQQLLLTLDFHVGKELSDEQCAKASSVLMREDRCLLLSHAVSLLQIEGDFALRLSEARIEGRVTAISASSDRLFVATTLEPLRSYVEEVEWHAPRPLPETRILIFDIEGDELGSEPSSIETLFGDLYDLYTVEAIGTKLITHQAGKLLVLDASDAEHPSVERHELSVPHCYLAQVTAEHALCLSGWTAIELIEL